MGLVVANGFREAVQVEKGGIRWPALVVQHLRHVERFPVPTGKPLQITGAAATAEDAQHRHQREEPLGVTHPTPESTIRYGLEETDQIARTVTFRKDVAGRRLFRPPGERVTSPWLLCHLAVH